MSKDPVPNCVRQWAANADVSTHFHDFSSCVENAPRVVRANAAIDNFYGVHERLSKLAAVGIAELRAEDLDSFQYENILLRHVGAVEQYFRDVHAGSFTKFSLVRGRLAKEVVPIGALDFYSENNVQRALTERLTLTESGKVTDFLRKVWDLTSLPGELRDSSQRFEKMVVLRHAIIHSGGILNFQNSDSMGFDAAKESRKVKLTASDLDAAAGLCLDLVRAANKAISQHVIFRFALTTDWSIDGPEVDEFCEGVVEVFVSRVDSSNWRRDRAVAKVRKVLIQARSIL